MQIPNKLLYEKIFKKIKKIIFFYTQELKFRPISFKFELKFFKNIQNMIVNIFLFRNHDR